MKIAFIISEIESQKIGTCLSSAKVFSVYDEASNSFYSLEQPEMVEGDPVAKKLSLFLRDNGINICVGNDLGPKAKASLEENGIMWFNPQENENKEDIIKQIKNS